MDSFSAQYFQYTRTKFLLKTSISCLKKNSEGEKMFSLAKEKWQLLYSGQ
ncbi:hypothetical protein [Bacteroides caccae]